MKNLRSDMPRASAIASWWIGKEPYMHCDEGEPTCWACRMIDTSFDGDLLAYDKVGFERCHLHAVSAGGSNDLANLVLLCPACHREFDKTFEGLEEERDRQLSWISGYHARRVWAVISVLKHEYASVWQLMEGEGAREFWEAIQEKEIGHHRDPWLHADALARATRQVLDERIEVLMTEKDDIVRPGRMNVPTLDGHTLTMVGACLMCGCGVWQRVGTIATPVVHATCAVTAPAVP